MLESLLVPHASNIFCGHRGKGAAGGLPCGNWAKRGASPVDALIPAPAVHHTEVRRGQQGPDAVCVHRQGLDAPLLAEVPQPDGVV